MPTPSLRRLAALALLPLLAACGGSPSASNTPPDPPAPPAPPEEGPSAAALWLQANAHPLRSLDVADRDFSDLQPLKAAIGSARVVMLGEESHGDGTTFLAKARLIAFLHEEMGFDVLAWESGLWGVHRAWEHVQAGEAALPAGRRAIFSVWSRSEQVLPTLDYVQETVGTARPLEMAGFDNQEAGTLARDSLHLLVERFARRIGSPVADDPEWPAAAATLQHLAQTGDLETHPFPAEQARLLHLLAALRADAAAKAGADPDARFWTQALASLASFAEMEWAMQPPGEVSGQNDSFRDAQMARNLVWLANVWYPEKKIIVWAASSHVARDVLQLRTPAGVTMYATWDVHMGGDAYKTLGTEMYAIGFTAGTGTTGRLGFPTAELGPPRAGSLEARFQEAGLVNAFVDFRSRPAGGDWLKDVYARPLGYGDLLGDWTRVLDGMIYTRDMVPSTKATR